MTIAAPEKKEEKREDDTQMRAVDQMIREIDPLFLTIGSRDREQLFAHSSAETERKREGGQRGLWRGYDAQVMAGKREREEVRRRGRVVCCREISMALEREQRASWIMRQQSVLPHLSQRLSQKGLDRPSSQTHTHTEAGHIFLARVCA